MLGKEQELKLQKLLVVEIEGFFSGLGWTNKLFTTADFNIPCFCLQASLVQLLNKQS